MDDKAIRTHVAMVLDWGHAHADFDAAVKGVAPNLRGVVPIGWEYSAWQLVEHIRIAQADILAFCVAGRYNEKKWPDDYWPKRPAPSNAKAWTAAIAAFRRDRKAFQTLARDPRTDLGAIVPHGTPQTYLREILLAADHTAYHVGQLVALRKTLGIWQ